MAVTERRSAGLHIYLTPRERRELIAWAESESRSASSQVMHIVRAALASRDGILPASAHDELVERIRNATRNGLAKRKTC
jgi:hypothetical protein